MPDNCTTQHSSLNHKWTNLTNSIPCHTIPLQYSHTKLERTSYFPCIGYYVKSASLFHLNANIIHIKLKNGKKT